MNFQSSAIFKLHQKLKNIYRWTLFSTLSGAMAGGAAAFFLILLDAATAFRNQNSVIIWLLPIAGFAIGWVYAKYGQDIAGGNNLILDEIHDPQKRIPLHMAPFIFVGTLVTHLFGGSAGREGTAVQMGSALSDQLTRFFKIEPTERQILLMAGAGAGFGAAIGAPWAGAIFGMEVARSGGLRPYVFLPCLIASFVGYGVCLLLGAPHSQFPKPEIPDWNVTLFFGVAVAGLCFGLTARIFSFITHFVENFCQRWIKHPPLKPFLGGLLLVILYSLEGSYNYVGLGIPHIQNSLETVANFKDPAFKVLFTSLTVGTGFKGGEFIPLVFIGTTLGSALSLLLPVGFSLLAALGFAAVFGGASKTPIACTLMAMEIFGYQIAPFALLACYLSYYFSGAKGIYKSQRNFSLKKITST